MAISVMMKAFAAVVGAMLLHAAGGVPIGRQSETNPLIQKRSALSVEFLMGRDSHSEFTHREDSLTHVPNESWDEYDNDLICPEKISTGVDDPIYKRSSCPWYYVKTHDPRRFPAVILRAAPLCAYAIGSNYSLDCSAVTQAMTVLRQQDYKDEKGNYVWQEVVEYFEVGFTATGRRTSGSLPTTPVSDDHTPIDYDKR